MIPVKRYRGKRGKLAYSGSRVKTLLCTAPDTFLATGYDVSYLAITLRLVYLILSAWVSGCVCTGPVSGGLLVNLKSSAAPYPTIPRVSVVTAVSDSPDGSKSHLCGQQCLLHQVLLSKFLRIFCVLFSTCFRWKPRFN